VSSHFQSINQNLYSVPSRYLLRGTPDPGQAEKNSHDKVVDLRTGIFWVFWKSIPGYTLHVLLWTVHQSTYL